MVKYLLFVEQPFGTHKTTLWAECRISEYKNLLVVQNARLGFRWISRK